MHGDDAHSFTFTAHVAPVNPEVHAHTNPFTLSVHTPPFWHGDDAHSLMFDAHVAPVNPAAQVHR